MALGCKKLLMGQDTPQPRSAENGDQELGHTTMGSATELKSLFRWVFKNKCFSLGYCFQIGKITVKQTLCCSGAFHVQSTFTPSYP